MSNPASQPWGLRHGQGDQRVDRLTVAIRMPLLFAAFAPYECAVNSALVKDAGAFGAAHYADRGT